MNVTLASRDTNEKKRIKRNKLEGGGVVFLPNSYTTVWCTVQDCTNALCISFQGMFSLFHGNDPFLFFLIITEVIIFHGHLPCSAGILYHFKTHSLWCAVLCRVVKEPFGSNPLSTHAFGHKRKHNFSKCVCVNEGGTGNWTPLLEMPTSHLRLIKGACHL